MKINIEVEKIESTVFGVGIKEGMEKTYRILATNKDLQGILLEMVKSTALEMSDSENSKSDNSVQSFQYEPSEKYGSQEYLTLPMTSSLATTVNKLFTAENIKLDMSVLKNPDKIFCYFASFTDMDGKKILAVRRATQFKATIGKHMIQLASDALVPMKNDVFKLDGDFDLIMDSDCIHILHPSGFEIIGELSKAILAAVPENIKKISGEMKTVDFSTIEAYAIKHPRAADYISSICSFDQAKDVDHDKLLEECKAFGVEVTEEAGKIKVKEDHVMGFLDVLDRRRYKLELVKGKPELYKAVSRYKIAK